MTKLTLDTRIERRFATLADERRAGLVAFITAGDPDLATSQAILESPARRRGGRDRARHAVFRSHG